MRAWRQRRTEGGRERCGAAALQTTQTTFDACEMRGVQKIEEDEAVSMMMMDPVVVQHELDEEDS